MSLSVSRISRIYPWICRCGKTVPAHERHGKPEGCERPEIVVRLEGRKQARGSAEIEETKMDVTIGRIVLYKLTEQDAKEINRRRTTGALIAERIKKNTADASAWPLGAQAHIGNEVHDGDVFPMLVTRIWSPSCVNGQVLLDGNDCLWATSATEGTGGHCWCWPPRV